MDLALSSLLECAGYSSDMSNISIEREVYTRHGRIDLVINSDECIIAIENKVFHAILNDFGDYSKYINREAKGRNTVLLILGMSKVDCSKYSGFTSVTYNEYFAAIKTNIGRYITNSNNKYLILLLEFMKTIEHLIEGTTMDKELALFFKDNLQAINAFMDAYDVMRNEMRNKVSQLSQNINIDAPEGLVKQKFYREQRDLYDVLVHDITADFPIAIDCTISPEGWAITIFDRKSGNMDKLDDLLKEIEITYPLVNGRFKADVQYGFDAQIETVAETLSSLLSKIIAKVSKEQ